MNNTIPDRNRVLGHWYPSRNGLAVKGKFPLPGELADGVDSST
jgi:hypothetical protein